MIRGLLTRLRRTLRTYRDRVFQWLMQRTDPIRARVRPVTSIVSGPAWWAALLAISAWFVSTNLLHWVELEIAAIMMMSLLTMSLLFVVGSHKVTAQIVLGRDRIVAGETASGELLVRNSSSSRSLPLIVEMPVDSVDVSFNIPNLAASAAHSELFTIPTDRRAVLDVGPVYAVRADPLRLFNRERQIAPVTELYVHPRTISVTGSASGLVRDLEGAVIPKIADHDVAFHALRDYVPGDDRRMIHWKSTARTGSLMVRQFEETRRAHLLIILSTRASEYASDDEFELAVSVAGSLGSQALRDEQELTLRSSERRLSSPGARVLLDGLAGIDFESHAPRIALAARAAEAMPTGASVAVLVCGSLVSDAMLRRARTYLSVDTRVAALCVHPEQQTSLRRVGDLDLVSISLLEDLPVIMRRLSA